MQWQRGIRACRAATNHGSVACSGGGVLAERLASAVNGSGGTDRKFSDSLLYTPTLTLQMRQSNAARVQQI